MVRLPPSSQLEVIFFDAAGTLFELREPVGTGYARLAEPFGLHLDPRQTQEAFKQAWKELPSPYPSPSESPERDWWQNLVKRVLETVTGSTPAPDVFDPYFQTLWDFYGSAEAWQLYPEVPEVLLLLYGYACPLGIISNFDSRLHPVLKGLGVHAYFDPIILSADVRSTKPNPRIFQAALEAANCQASQALHVGDDPRMDWDGAEQAGLTAWRLDRSQNSLEDLARTLCT